MKKLWIILVLVLLFCSCGTPPVSEDSGEYKDTASSGVWISYSELNNMLSSENGFENEFDKVISNLNEMKIENLYIHVRAFGDSLYKSNYFPLMKTAIGYEYDILEHIITDCKQSGIKVHAWINPYRISTSTTDVNTLGSDSPVYKWLNDDDTQNDRNVCFSNGIYLNPAEVEVQSIVIGGIKEIIEKYDVDGIHFDDYFYPTDDPLFDEASYKAYCNNKTNPLSLEDWRRNNVNSLISGCYSAIKYINKDVAFSISPMASIDNNYNKLYADVKEWIDGGYIDFIIPQLYFGFEYPDESFRFNNLLNEWKKLTKNSETGLIIGLANYKSVPELDADKEEWENNSDIISRQVKLCFQDGYVQGYVYFSYSSLFSSEEPYAKQRENILKLEINNG